MSSYPPDAARRRAEGIYIARGENTLGPYTPAEAAARLSRGELRPGDQVARDGDAAWMPLSQLLAALPTLPVAGTNPAHADPAPTDRSHRRWQLAVLAALLGGYCLGAGPRWLERRMNSRPFSVAPPVAVSNKPAPIQTPAGATLLVSNPRPQPVPAPVVDSRLHGTLVLTAPADGEIDTAGVQVAAYPLAFLESYLAQKRTQAQAEIDRLNPQLQTAEADLAARRADEQAALRAWQECELTDPLRPSLRFAHEAAKAAVKTSEDDYHYLLDARGLLTGGAFYFQDLPAPTIRTETDAEGGYSLNLPPEGYPYAVAASVRQPTANGGERTYYWLVNVGRPRSSESEALRLDGSNLASANAPESLIHVTN